MRATDGRLAALAAAALALVPGWPVPARAAAPPSITSTVACPQPPAFSVRVQGIDFNPFTVVLVTFDAARGGRPEAFDAQTDGFGRFDLTIQPAPRPPGSYVVRADDLREREVEASVDVDCAVPPGSAATAVFHPTLRFHPGVTRRGFVVVLIGTGFPPSSKVSMQWGELRSRDLEPTLTTDAGGNLVLPRPWILVFQETPSGTSVQVVAAAGGPEQFDPVTAKLLVVPGTAQPPDFNERR